MAEDLKGMPTFEPVGNMDTMNLHNILYQNIIASPYFKSLYEKKTYNKVVDEIYNQGKRVSTPTLDHSLT